MDLHLHCCCVAHPVMLTTVCCHVFVIKSITQNIMSFCSASPCLFLVLPSVEQLSAATQAAANWHSSSEQPGGALPLAELPDPREIQVSSPICGHSICDCIANTMKTPTLSPCLCNFFSLFLSAAIWKDFWKSLQTLPKRTRSRSSTTCWDHTCSGGWRLMFSNTCLQRLSLLLEWSWAPCRSKLRDFSNLF